MNLSNRVLVDIALKILPYARKGETVTYSQLSEDIDQRVAPMNLGKYLTAISNACFEEDMPLLSSIVVSEETAIPSDGYFRQLKALYGAEDDGMTIWQTECDEVFMYKSWIPLIQRLRSEE